ncbi:hypothetical protein BRM22_03965, partial [Xanthomonas oryzae pv. oryzae]
MLAISWRPFRAPFYGPVAPDACTDSHPECSFAGRSVRQRHRSTQESTARSADRQCRRHLAGTRAGRRIRLA